MLVGQSLIEGAQVRAQISQIEALNTATNAFRIKYNNTPGDIHQTMAAQFGFSSLSMSVANQIRFNNGFIDACCANSLESFYFLKQLQQANLIECTGCNPAGYTFTNATWDAIFTKAKIDTQSNVEMYGGQVYSGGFGTEQSYGKNYFEIFQSALATSGVRAMSPSQSFSIDSKADDGLPLTGRVIATNYAGYWDGTRTPSQGAAGSSACVSTSSSPSVYNTTNSNRLCNLRFEAQF